MNRVEFMGRIATDLELRYIPTSGKAVTQFSLAVTDPYKKAKGEENDADFFHVTVFGTRAESLCTHMKKGRNLIVCGRLRNRQYDDKQGIKRYVTEVVASEVHFIDWGGNKKGSGDNQSQNFEGHGEYGGYGSGFGDEMIPVDDGDIPF